MRTWVTVHRKTVVVLVLVAVWSAAVALLVSWGQRPDQVLLSSAMWAVFVAGSWYADARRQRRTTSKLDAQGRMLVYIRYPDSLPGSLSGLWNMGVATFDEAALTFQPAVYDTLEPSGRPTTLRVLGVRSSEPRKIERKETKYLTHVGFKAIRLSTDKGDVEIAGRPESLSKISAFAAGPESS